MSTTFWLGMILLVGGVVMYIFTELVNPWAWIIVAIIGAIVAIVAASSVKKAPTKKTTSKKGKK